MYKGRNASVENVKRLFSSTSGNTVSIEDVFRSWPRDPNEEKINRGWLSNLLSLIKFHNLVKPIYTTKNGPKTLVELQLTPEGKEVLGRATVNSSNSEMVPSSGDGKNNVADLDDIAKKIAKWEQQNEQFEVTFNVRLKGVKSG